MRRDKIKKLARKYAAAHAAHENFKMEFNNLDEQIEAQAKLLMAQFELDYTRSMFATACRLTIIDAEKRIMGEEDADL